MPSSASSGQPRSLTPSISAPAVQVHLQGPVPPLPAGGKRELEQSFPPCPTSWVDRAASLGSANLSPRSRVLRAWRAGQWARRVLQGQYATPLPSENLRLASRFYVVVAATRSLLFTGPFESSTRPSAPLHPLSRCRTGFLPSLRPESTWTRPACRGTPCFSGGGVLPFSERGQVWIYEHASGDGAIVSRCRAGKKAEWAFVGRAPRRDPDDELAVAPRPWLLHPLCPTRAFRQSWWTCLCRPWLGFHPGRPSRQWAWLCLSTSPVRNWCPTLPCFFSLPWTGQRQLVPPSGSNTTLQRKGHRSPSKSRSAVCSTYPGTMFRRRPPRVCLLEAGRQSRRAQRELRLRLWPASSRT